ncbi:MAG: hypothetical protein ACU84Q_20240 [Gammaproteobacteria bacterium]
MAFSSKLVSTAVLGLALCSGSTIAFTTINADGVVTKNGGGDVLNIGEGATQMTPANRPLSGDTMAIAGTRNGFAYDLPSNFTVLDTREFALMLPDEDDPTEIEEVGTVFDQVWRDTNDNSLVFATRVEIEGEFELDEEMGSSTFGQEIWEYEEGEINDVRRAGFTGWSSAVAWLRGTDFDIEMESAARTGESLLGKSAADMVIPYADIVTMFSDVSGEESNPWSACATPSGDTAQFSSFFFND